MDERSDIEPVITNHKAWRPQAAAIIVAAGQGTRMGADIPDKIWTELAGVPVILHAIRAFHNTPCIDAIVLVLREERIDRARRIIADEGMTKVVDIRVGGVRRQDSVRAGLDSLQGRGCDVVLIHDGARPLVDAEMIERGVEFGRKHGAAVAAIPVVDTIKQVDSEGGVVGTPRRAELLAVQTPQAFNIDLLLRAYVEGDVDVTDDAMLVERLGHRVWTFPGSRRNLKITTPEDLIIAAAFLAVTSA